MIVVDLNRRPGNCRREVKLAVNGSAKFHLELIGAFPKIRHRDLFSYDGVAGPPPYSSAIGTTHADHSCGEVILHTESEMLDLRQPLFENT